MRGLITTTTGITVTTARSVWLPRVRLLMLTACTSTAIRYRHAVMATAAIAAESPPLPSIYHPASHF